MVSRMGLRDIIAAAEDVDARDGPPDIAADALPELVGAVSREDLLSIIAAADDDVGVAGGGPPDVIAVANAPLDRAPGNRWHRGFQYMRAARGWASRRRASKNDGQDLHVAVHNHAQSLRVDDEMAYTGDSRKKITGQGRWKRWTVRAALRAAFCAPNICARTLSKTLYPVCHELVS